MQFFARCFLLLAIIAWVSMPTADAAQAAPQDGVMWGTNAYVEYVPGSSPIIITSSHGGYLTPPSIPDRQYGVLLPDRRTQEVARELAREIETRTGQRPHLIISHLSRLKLDPNREIVEAAQGDPIAELAWNEFHGFISQARATVAVHHGSGLLFDMHGHGHPLDRVEVGYALSGVTLSLSDAALNTPAVINTTTIRSLATQPGAYFPGILRGVNSIGGLLQSAGLDSVPGTLYPDPAGNPYFSGGYIVRQHGSRDGGTIDAIQIELPYSIRELHSTRAPFISAMGQALETFFSTHYGTALAAGERVSLRVDDAIATETGSQAVISLHRSGPASGPRVVALTTEGSASGSGAFQGIPASVLLSPGQSDLSLVLSPVDNATAQGTRTLRVVAEVGSATGSPRAAEVLMLDDEGDPDHLLHLPFSLGAGNLAIDATGLGWDAALLPAGGSGPSWVAGHTDSALLFDEVDDHLKLVDRSYAPGNDFSLSFWMKAAPTTQTSHQYVFSHGGLSQAPSLNIYFNETTGRLRTNLVRSTDINDAGQLDVEGGLRDGMWHHYALVSPELGLSRIHVDGICVATSNLGSGGFDPVGDVFIGAREDLNATRFFGGSLDDVRVYSRAITAAEVRALAWGMGNNAAVHPGSNDDLLLESGVSSSATSGPLQDVVSASAGDFLVFQVKSPLGAFLGSNYILGAQVFDPSAPPSVLGFPELHLSPFAAFVIQGPAPLPPGPGAVFSLQLSAANPLPSMRFLIQAVALGASSTNGIFGATNAHELVLNE